MMQRGDLNKTNLQTFQSMIDELVKVWGVSPQLSICTEFINEEKEAPGSGKIRVRVRCMAYLFLCLAV